MDGQRFARAVELQRARDLAAVERQLAQLGIEHASLALGRERHAANLVTGGLDAGESDVDIDLGRLQRAEIDRVVRDRREQVGRSLGLGGRRQVAVDVERVALDL